MFYLKQLGRDKGNPTNMLKAINVKNMPELINKVIPKDIIKPAVIYPTLSEINAIDQLKNTMNKNISGKSYIGMGFHPTRMPGVVKKNVFNNPTWYTAYTSYQTEVSQGKLEMLSNYQKMVCNLTGLPLANASLLDESSSVVEAIAMCVEVTKKKSVLISSALHPQNIQVVKTRCMFRDMNINITDNITIDTINALDNSDKYACMVLQYPNTFGNIEDYNELISCAKNKGMKVILVTDPLALTVLKTPGELGADIAVGTMQRFGIPMFFGGPHASYLACQSELVRYVPGRIVGESMDTYGNTAYRLALQTREQHIKKQKAISNICTSQALLAILSTFYAMHHGPEGIMSIANTTHENTFRLKSALASAGFDTNSAFFDTVNIKLNKTDIDHFYDKALNNNVFLRKINDEHLGISLNELTDINDVKNLAKIFECDDKLSVSTPFENPIQPLLQRSNPILDDDCFSAYSTETDLMRYMHILQRRDYSLVDGMIPLGSCTMKLNSAEAMEALNWDNVQNIHPYAPPSTTKGYTEMIDELDNILCKVTHFDKFSFQPNSGSSGELAGLIAIRQYLNNDKRNICLIPASAHGTNFASAKLAGFIIKEIKCDKDGSISLEHLNEILSDPKHEGKIGCGIITYPSTHGIFEESILDITSAIHDVGGQIYMDGANMNAQCGLTNPVICGADVCHLNLHKTFAIPHGGGGPGVGPIGVKKHLIPFLPDDSHMVSSAPHGSAGILTITHLYLKMLGSSGLTKVTERAILNANYLMMGLKDHFNVLYTNNEGFVGHEFIIDIRPFSAYKIGCMDVAKRILDYHFYSPTVSWPVQNTLMIEPTESESKEELDRFISMMISIREEIQEVIDGKYPTDNNVLVNSPHPHQALFGEWNYPYTREKAFQPFPDKFYPPVARIDDVAGDKNILQLHTGKK